MLRTVPACFHPEQKALVADRAFPLLAAEVAVAGARGKARSALSDPRLSRFLPGVPAALSRRPAAGRMCPVRLGGRNEAQAGDYRAACLCECLNTPNAAYPRFTGSSKKFCRTSQLYPVLLGDVQCC